MPTTREQLRRMAAERQAPPRGFAWEELMEALGQLEREARCRPAWEPGARVAMRVHPVEAAAVGALEEQDVRALADLVARRGRVPLRGTVPIPHAMPPEELIQFRALKILEDAGRLDTVRGPLERVEQEADSPALRGLARQLLSRLGPLAEE